MNLQQPSPPGGGALSLWCAGLLERLKHALGSLDDTNIVSVSAAKLTGSIDPGAVPVNGAEVTIDGASVTVKSGDAVIFRASSDGDIYIGSADGAEYIRLFGGHITMRVSEISCAALTAETINGARQETGS